MAIPLQKREYFECKYSNQLQPVSCIASFSNHGGVRPQYVQNHKNSDITFLCDIMEHDRVKMIELFFQRKIDQWFIKVR